MAITLCTRVCIFAKFSFSEAKSDSAPVAVVNRPARPLTPDIVREDFRLGVQVSQRVGKERSLLRHLPVLLSVLFPFQAHAGHAVLELTQLHGKAFAALPCLLLFSLKPGKGTLFLLKRLLRGVQFIQGGHLGLSRSGTLVGFLQRLDIALDLSDDFLLLPDPVGQALAGGGGTFLLQGDTSVLLTEVPHALLRLAVFLFKPFKDRTLFFQNLAAGCHIGGKFRLCRTRLHVLKLRFHPLQVGIHPVDDLPLLQDTGIDGSGGLLRLLGKDINRQTGLVKPPSQVVLHQKFDFYGLHRLQF